MYASNVDNLHILSILGFLPQYLGEKEILYAVGQGALAVECQEDNEEVLSLLTPLVHHDTVLCTLAERSFLRKLEGGCSAPVAVFSKVKDSTISLTGFVSSLDGSQSILESLECKLGTDSTNELNGSGNGVASTSEYDESDTNQSNGDGNEVGEPAE